MFALICSSDSPLDVPHLAGVLAEHRDFVFNDLMQQFSKSPGILFEDLAETEAQRLAALIQQYGVDVEVVPASQVVPMPRVEFVDTCELADGELRCGTPRELYQVPWSDVVWIDFASVGRLEASAKHRGNYALPPLSYDTQIPSRNLGGLSFLGSEPTTSSARLTEETAGHGGSWKETKWEPMLDIVPSSMDVVLRLNLEQFNFHSTGLKVHPRRQQNIWALCIGLVSRAKSAVCGPGVRWVRDAGLPERNRVASQERYDQLLRWHLTRITLGQEFAGVSCSSESTDELSEKLTELVMMCEAILSDGEISLDETKQLLRWLREHRNLALPAVQSLVQLMQQIVSDKVVTREEREELKVALDQLVRDH